MERNWLCWDVRPTLFSKVTLFSLYQKCCVGLKYAKNALAAEAPGQPLPNSYPSWRLDSHAFGAQLLWPTM